MALVVSITVLAVASLVLLRAIDAAAALSRSTQEMDTADEAARRILERIHATTFSEAFVRWNGTTSDNPGTGTSPGAAFGVTGLETVDGDSDGLAGEILFPTASGAPGTLCELAGTYPGTPMDLNMDGDATDSSATVGHRILPVRVRVRWKSTRGENRLEIATVLTELP